jgi:hypothetical protein
MPVLADPYETMTIYNERAMNNISGGNIIYTEANFEAFRNGTRRTTDWTSCSSPTILRKPSRIEYYGWD